MTPEHSSPVPAVLTDDRIQLNIPTTPLQRQQLLFLWLGGSRGRSLPGRNCPGRSHQHLHWLTQLRSCLGCFHSPGQSEEDKAGLADQTDSPLCCAGVLVMIIVFYSWSSRCPAPLLPLEPPCTFFCTNCSLPPSLPANCNFMVSTFKKSQSQGSALLRPPGEK